MSILPNFHFPNGTLLEFGGYAVVVTGFCPDGIVVRNEIQDGPSQNFVIEHAELQKILARVDFSADYNYARDTAEEAKLAAAAKFAVKAWADASQKEREEALMKEAWALACREIIPGVRYTWSAIERYFDKIEKEALARQKRLHRGRDKAGAFKAKTWSPKRISQFCQKYFGQLRPTAEVLLNQKNSGNTNPGHMTSQACKLLTDVCKKYRSTEQPSKASIVTEVKKAFDAASAALVAKGLPALSLPHKNTVYRRLARIPLHEKILGRDGLQEAQKLLSPTEHGVRVLKPGELIELDFQHVDVFTLREKSEFWGILAPDLQEKLEDQERTKPKKKQVQRLWVCAAIDVATRMILGVGVAETANVRTVIEVLDMVTRSKAELSRMAGCVATWFQATGLGTIVVDTGNEFFNEEIQAVILSMGGAYIYGRTGVPMDKPYIERFFGTLRTMFSDKLPGKTGYSPDCLVAYDREGWACFDANVFRQLLYRFIVDYYPLLEHAGLHRKRPIDQWKEAQKYGAIAPPSVRVRRAATGLKLTRKLTKEGIHILGVPFGDMTQFPKEIWGENVDLEIRLDPTDFREVTAFYKGKHYFLENKRPDLAHHSVRTLMAALHEMRATRPSDLEFYEYALAKYTKAIDDKIEHALSVKFANVLASHGMPSTELNEKTLAWFEDSFVMNLHIRENPQETLSADMETLLSGGTGRGISTPEMIEEEKSRWAVEEAEEPEDNTPTEANPVISSANDTIPGEGQGSAPDRPSDGTKSRKHKAPPDKKSGRKYSGEPKGRGSFK